MLLAVEVLGGLVCGCEHLTEQFLLFVGSLIPVGWVRLVLECSACPTGNWRVDTVLTSPWLRSVGNRVMAFEHRI